MVPASPPSPAPAGKAAADLANPAGRGVEISLLAIAGVVTA